MAYLPILTYHRLLKDYPDKTIDPKRIAVSQAQFRSHLACLARLGYRTTPLHEYAKDLRAGKDSKPRLFAVTFDDGYEEVLTLALPVLQEFGFTATVFAVPGQLGGVNAWDDGRARLLNAGEYRELQRAGLEIGAHTCRHDHLPQIALDAARREIADSKKQLEDVLGQIVPLFAYPYGESNPAVESLVQEAGFHAAFATDRAPRDHAANLFKIRRVVIFPRSSVWNVLWKVQRWYPAYQDWKRKDGSP